MSQLLSKIKLKLKKLWYKKYFRFNDGDKAEDRILALASRIEILEYERKVLLEKIAAAEHTNLQLITEKDKQQAVLAVRQVEIEELTAVVARNHQRILAETGLFKSQVGLFDPREK